MKEVKFYCDIKGCKNQAEKDKKVFVPVWFTTEQNEGRPTGTYIEWLTLHLCPICKEILLAGNPIWGEGAQGHNTYYFKVDSKKRVIIDLIEKMKYNRVPFGLLAEEEQDVLREVGKSNCLVYEPWRGGFTEPGHNSRWVLSSTYRLKPDYQPEPEIVRYELSKDGQEVRVILEDGTWYHIHSDEMTKLEKWIYESLLDNTAKTDK